MQLRTLVLAAGLLWSVSSFSQDEHVAFRSSNALYKDCTAQTNDLVARSLCLGYVAGAADMLDEMKVTCRPTEVTVGQMRDIVVNYHRDHPESRHYAAPDEVSAVLAKTFPCKK